ncbi:DUF4118 domain-containing protein [Streptomyces sp. RPT161]|uniref:DUF4118 domain-containing protein n=1 Tax=Streptomyces sp. RPT161 TaxID=3015993 RepID=UPI0022B909F7|nr:DUF4118 domain-containing protein [Streptomyces sp. RPT161]
MRRFLHRDLAAIVAGLVAPLAVAAALVSARAHISNTDVALVLVVVIVAVAAIGHRVAGALAALSAAAWFDFFFTRPYERFAITKSADIRTAVLLLLVGLAVSQLAARARRLKVITVTDAQYLGAIHATAARAQTATSAAQVVDQVKRQLTELLQLRDCRFEYGSLLGHPAQLRPDGSVLVGRRSWDVDQQGLPDEEIELRAFGNGRYLGRFMMRPAQGAKPPLQARLVAVTLAEQAGSALDTAGTTLED